MSRWVIVGAGDRIPPEEAKAALRSDDRIICADGGYDLCLALGLVPELVVGDLDSLREPLPDGFPVMRHDPRKDDTDSRLAAAYAMEQGADSLLFLGVLGGRLDHTLANLQTLGWCSSQGIPSEILGGGVRVLAVTGGRLRIDPAADAYLSIFAWGGQAMGVTVQGVEYPLDMAVLTPLYPLGVSNEFTGLSAEISVSSGTLLVLIQDKQPLSFPPPARQPKDMPIAN